MREQANNILSIMDNFGLKIDSNEKKEEFIQKVEESLNEMSLLKEAVKVEIEHQASNENLELTETDVVAIAQKMVYDSDWSSFNEWITNEIEEYQSAKQ